MSIRVFSTLILCLPFAALASDGKLQLKIEGVRSEKGHVLISVYNKADGFPSKPTKAVRIARMGAKTSELSRGFSGLKTGTEYAVAYIHDENDNHKLDTDDKGVPTEGFGFSNNPDIKGAAATYDQAKFKLKAGGEELRLKTVYPSAQ